MGDDAGSGAHGERQTPRMRELPFADVRRADVIEEVADVAYRRIRIQRSKGSRVRLLYLKVAHGLPVEMIDSNGTVVNEPRIPDEKLQRILDCEVWFGVGTTWTPQACRARTYQQAKRRSLRRRR